MRINGLHIGSYGIGHPMMMYFFLLCFGLPNYLQALTCQVTIGPDRCICKGDSVTLTATPAGCTAPYTYLWNTGETTPSIKVKPSNVGTYNYMVTLTSSILHPTATVKIYVQPKPNAGFSISPGSPTQVCSTDSLTFIADITPSNPANLSYNYYWDFGDNSNIHPTSRIVKHRFYAIGYGTHTFNVKLTTSWCQCSYDSIIQVIVKDIPPVKLNGNFAQCNLQPCLNLTINYASTPPPSPSCLYEIDWDYTGIFSPDYSSTTPPSNLQNIYCGINFWTLRFRVTNQTTGCIHDTAYTVFNGSNPGGAIDPPANTVGLCGTPTTLWFKFTPAAHLNSPGTKYHIEFFDKEGGEITFYQDFFQNNIDSIERVYTSSSCGYHDHPENFDNTFGVRCTITNPCFQNNPPSWVHKIQISEKPTPDFTISETHCSDTNIVLTATTALPYFCNSQTDECTTSLFHRWSISPQTYTLNVGQTLTSNPLTLMFNENVTYTITLIDSNDCSVVDTSKQFCMEKKPHSGFTIDTDTICMGSIITVTDTTNNTNFCSSSYRTWTIEFNGAGLCTPSSNNWEYIGGGNPHSQSPSIKFNENGTYRITLAIINECDSIVVSKSVFVARAPKITITPPITPPQLCVPYTYIATAVYNDCFAPISPHYDTSYHWTINNIEYNQQTPPPVFFTLSGDYPVKAWARNECGVDTGYFTLSLNVSPSLNTIENDTICSESSTFLNLSSSPPGASFTWTASIVNGNISGFYNGSGNLIAQSLTNNGANTGVVAYHITPTIGGCSGSTIDVLVVVNPRPIVNQNLTPPSPPGLCSGDPVSITFSSLTTGTTFSWTATGSSSTVSGFTDGSGNSLLQTLTNTSFTDQTVTYHVTGTANGCAGPVNTIDVIVRPIPDLSNSPLSKRICSNTSTGINLTSNVTGTTFTWTCTSSGSVSGYASGSLPSTSIDQTLINFSDIPQTVTYHIIPEANGCVGSSTDYIVTVNPRPTPTITGNASPFQGSTSTYFTETGQINYVWTITPTYAFSGGGNGNYFVDINWSSAGSYVLCVNYELSFGGLSCNAEDSTCMNIDVNPCPQQRTVITDQGNTFCEGETGISIGVENSESGISYKLYNQFGSLVRGPMVGDGTTKYFSPPITVSGTYTVIALNTVSLCTVTMTPSQPVTVFPLPAPVVITPSGPWCATPPLGIQLGLSYWEPGIEYEYGKYPDTLWQSGGPSPILGYAIDSGLYIAKATDQATGCSRLLNGDTLIVTPLPIKYAMSPVGDLCTCQDITLEHTQPGFEYTLINTRNPVPSPPILYGLPSGGAITFDSVCDEGRYRIVARDTLNPYGTNCFDTMNYVLILHKNPIPYSILPNDSKCQSVGVSLSWSEPDVVYELVRNGTQPIRYRHGSLTPGPIDFGMLDFTAQEGTYTIIGRRWISNNSDSCETTMVGQLELCKKPMGRAMAPSGPGPLCHVSTISVMNPESNVTYHLMKDYLIIDSQTGSSIDFHSNLIPPDLLPEFAPGVYNIKAVHTCTDIECDSTFGDLVISQQPTINAGPADTTLCNSSPYSIDLFGTATYGSTYSWSSSSNCLACFSAPTSLNTTYTFSPIDLNNGVVTLTLTANGLGGCSTATVSDPIVVHIVIPEVNQPVNQVVCHDGTTALVHFTSPSSISPVTYTWNNSNTLIGLVSSGTGDIQPFNATNTSHSPITSTIVVTPHYFNISTGIMCDGPTKSFTITVNPPGEVDAISDQVWCHNETVPQVTLTTPNTVGTTVFSWTNSDPSIGLLAFGVGDIPSFTATNNTSMPKIATVTITPTFSFLGKDCPGTPQTYTIVVNPTGQVNDPANQEYCHGQTTASVVFETNNSVGTTNYTWTNSNPSIGLAGAGIGDIPAFVATNLLPYPVVATITITPTFTYLNKDCEGPTQSYTITINPSGQVNDPEDEVWCNGETTLPVTLSTLNTGGITTYSWNNSNPTIGLPGAGMGIIPPFLATNTSNSPIYAIITITPTFTNGAIQCVGTPQTYTITVNPSGQVNDPSDQFFCHEDIAPIVALSTIKTGGFTSYVWGNSNSSIGLGTAGVGNVPSFTATNYGNVPVFAVVTITPTYTNAGKSCTGPTQSYNITVNPAGQVNVPTNQTWCNGDITAITPLITINSGGTTTFEWTNSDPSIGLAANGNGDIPSFTATNLFTSPVTATITIIPTFTYNGIACDGVAQTFLITINPSGQVNTLPNQVWCNQDPTTPVTFSTNNSGGVTTYSWTNSNPAIGLTTSGGGNIPSFIATNSGPSPITATITITPTFIAGGLNCVGTPTAYTITVNPSGQINIPSDTTFCHGEQTSTIVFTTNNTGGVTTYSWTNSAPSIGLAGAGIGNIPAFIATNLQTTPITAIITVIPKFSYLGKDCQGTAQTFTITVNPRGEVIDPPDQVWCNGELTDLVILNSNNSGGLTTYSWTNSNSSIGLANAGVGNIPQFIATNNGNSPEAALITIMPTFSSGGINCLGTPETYSITVNPTAQVNQPSDQSLCNGNPTTPIVFSTINTGGTSAFTWTNNQPTIGLSASGTGNILSFTATNTGPLPIIATIIVSPHFEFAGKVCDGPSKSFTITVNPTPTPSVTSGQSPEACINTPFTYMTQPGMTGYDWHVAPAGTYLSSFPAPGDMSSIEITWTTVGAKTIWVNYSNEYGCVAPVPTETYHLTAVNPPVPIVLTGPLTPCINTSENYYTTLTGMSEYTWVISGGGVITNGQGTNQIQVTWNNAGIQWVRVNYVGPGGCSGVNPTPDYQVIVEPLPSPSISGTNTLCVGAPPTTYYTQGGKTNYIWGWNGCTKVAGGSILDSSITVVWSSAGPPPTHNISVSYTDIFGCTSANPTVYSVTVNPLPIPFIAGSDSACKGNAVVYTTTPGMSNYTWGISPGGTGSSTTNSITVTWNTEGVHYITLSYTDVNGCVAAAPTIKNVTVYPLPSPSISGSANVCLNEPTYGYSTQAGMTGYSWLVTGGTIINGLGTNLVTVKWTSSGNQTISVNYTDIHGCQASAPTVFTVNVNTVPSPTITCITFPLDPCVNSNNNHYLTETGMSGYNWTISSGGIITGGSGTSEIIVTWNGSGSQWVAVTYTNPSGCTTAVPTVYPVSVNPLPVPYLINPGQSLCKDSTLVYTAPVSMSNYIWDVSPGGTILGATGNTITVKWNTPGPQFVSINYTDPNYCTGIAPTVYPVTVLPLPSPTISGSGSVCINAPGYIYFTQQGMTNYIWTIDGGTIDNGNGTSVVSVTWTTLGLRSLSVKYTNANGCTNSTPTVFHVTVNPSPIPIITGPVTACVQSTGLVYQTESGMTAYSWSISSGGVITNGSSTNTVTVNWYNPGNQTISVGYTNGNNCASSTPSDYNVMIYDLPVADFDVSSNCLGISTVFTDASTSAAGNPIISRLWNFGDGGTSTQTNPNHLYSNAGTYYVSLQVNTQFGCQHSITNQVVIFPNPVASFTISNHRCSGDSVYFTDYSTTTGSAICVWRWDFGDGAFETRTTGQNPNVSHAYNITNTSNFTVTLKVTTTDSCKNEISIPLTVYPKPAPSFYFDTVNCMNLSMQFHDISQTVGGIPIIERLWNFGEPSSGTNNFAYIPEPWHMYSSADTFDVWLRVENNRGCADSIMQSVIIDSIPYADYTYSGNCQDTVTHFTDASIPGSGSLATFAWDFGDPASGGNNTSTNQNPDHLFSQAGTYFVSLVTTNSNSCSDSIIKPVIIHPKPIADFEYSSACQNSTMQFTDLSIAPNSQITHWTWDFGDGSALVVDVQNPTHVYVNPGVFQVKLWVENLYGCFASRVKPVDVKGQPSADFTYTSYFCPSGLVDFLDLSSAYGVAAIISREWYFEPGSTVFTINPDISHIYQVTDTTYLDTLIVTDNFGCKDTLVKSVVVKPAYELSMTYDTVCFGDTTHFSAFNLAGPLDPLSSIVWDFDDPDSGPYDSAYSVNATHIFTKPGSFLVRLKARNSNLCLQSIIKLVIVNPLPNASFSFDVASCDSIIKFYDHSTPGGGIIQSWEWNFGDPGSGSNNTATIQNPVHHYTDSNPHTVSLKVTNSSINTNDVICYSIETKTVQLLECINALFTSTNDHYCARTPVVFYDNSITVSRIIEWHWQFGDGSESIYGYHKDTVIHQYADSGYYTISLTVKAISNGAFIYDNFTKRIYIATRPSAAFTSEGLCIHQPALFHDISETFNNLGLDTITRTWNFGDPSSGNLNTSSLIDPVHIFSNRNYYYVKLLVENLSGCSDSSTQKLLIHGLPSASFSFSKTCAEYPVYFEDTSIPFEAPISTYLWTFGDVLSGGGTSSLQAPTFIFESGGLYPVKLQIKDDFGCEDLVDTVIQVINNPVSSFNIKDNYLGKTGQILLTNHSKGASRYLWDFGNGDFDTISNPVVSYTNDSTYLIVLIATNSEGCSDSSFFEYELLVHNLFVPNAFCPVCYYDDERILTFKPIGCGLAEYRMEVFDVYGHVLFETTSLDTNHDPKGKGCPVEGWDGTCNGVLMPQGTYMWKISATFKDGFIWKGTSNGINQPSTMGSISLIR